MWPHPVRSDDLNSYARQVACIFKGMENRRGSSWAEWESFLNKKMARFPQLHTRARDRFIECGFTSNIYSSVTDIELTGRVESRKDYERHEKEGFVWHPRHDRPIRMGNAEVQIRGGKEGGGRKARDEDYLKCGWRSKEWFAGIVHAQHESNFKEFRATLENFCSREAGLDYFRILQAL